MEEHELPSTEQVLTKLRSDWRLLGKPLTSPQAAHRGFRTRAELPNPNQPEEAADARKPAAPSIHPELSNPRLLLQRAGLHQNHKGTRPRTEVPDPRHPDEARQEAEPARPAAVMPLSYVAPPVVWGEPDKERPMSVDPGPTPSGGFAALAPVPGIAGPHLWLAGVVDDRPEPARRSAWRPRKPPT